MGTKLFVVSIKSVLAVSYAQWNKKNNDDNSFTPVDVNAEDYKGTSNSLPCPVLVFKQKQKELTQCFQIAVTNLVGTSYKMIQGNIELPEKYNNYWAEGKVNIELKGYGSTRYLEWFAL